MALLLSADQSEEAIQMDEFSANRSSRDEAAAEEEEGTRLVDSNLNSASDLSEQCQRIAQKFTEGLDERRGGSDEESSS